MFCYFATSFSLLRLLKSKGLLASIHIYYLNNCFQTCGNVDQTKLMFDKVPLNRTAIIGEHFELECDVTSSPQSKIIWKYGDKIVQTIELAPVALLVNAKLQSVYSNNIQVYTVQCCCCRLSK
jgi:hypothetical protein